LAHGLAGQWVVDRRRLPYRVMLGDQDFAIIYAQREPAPARGGHQRCTRQLRSACSARARARCRSMADWGRARVRAAAV